MTRRAYNTNLFSRAYYKRAQSPESGSDSLQIEVKNPLGLVITAGGLLFGAAGAWGGLSLYRSSTPPEHRKFLLKVLSGLGGFTAGRMIGSFATSAALSLILGALSKAEAQNPPNQPNQQNRQL